MTDRPNHALRSTANMALPSGISDKTSQLDPGIEEPGNTNDSSDVDDENEYAGGIGLLMLVISLMLGMFLVALDNVRTPQDQHSASSKTDNHLHTRPSSVPPFLRSPTNSKT